MILCADDYGLREDIDEAILDLCAARKLTSVSCLVAVQACSAERLGRLRQHERALDIGLHLCLTHEDALSPEAPDTVGRGGCAPSFNSLLLAALTGRAKPANFRQQIAAQYELFLKKCGRGPDYIDGHLHVHQLPGVREGLLEFVLSLPRERRPYIRNTAMPAQTLRRAGLPWVKALLIGTMGAATKRRLHHAGIATNEGFAGIYDFGKWRCYPEYLPKFTACLAERTGILVVHPGLEDPWRKQEYCALKQFAFAPASLNRFAVGG